MANRRIEFDPTDATPYAVVANQLANLADAQRREDAAAAIRQAGHLEAAAEELVDALLSDLDGVVSRRDMAVALGVVHGTVAYRITRHRTHNA